MHNVIVVIVCVVNLKW